jgi:CDP-diacylglycerol--glycerol-3-phosphate 3-phosphatidyltransferase
MATGPLRDRLREALSRYLETPASRFLASLGVSPGLLTALGFLVTVGAACLAGMGLLLAALLFSQMVSYTRARGEGLGVSCKVGLMTRPERVALLSLGLVLQGVGLDPALLVTVGVVALLSLLTTAQRFLHVRRQLKG